MKNNIHRYITYPIIALLLLMVFYKGLSYYLKINHKLDYMFILRLMYNFIRLFILYVSISIFKYFRENDIKYFIIKYLGIITTIYFLFGYIIYGQDLFNLLILPINIFGYSLGYYILKYWVIYLIFLYIFLYNYFRKIDKIKVIRKFIFITTLIILIMMLILSLGLIIRYSGVGGQGIYITIFLFGLLGGLLIINFIISLVLGLIVKKKNSKSEILEEKRDLKL